MENYYFVSGIIWKTQKIPATGACCPNHILWEEHLRYGVRMILCVKKFVGIGYLKNKMTEMKVDYIHIIPVGTFGDSVHIAVCGMGK